MKYLAILVFYLCGSLGVFACHDVFNPPVCPVCPQCPERNDFDGLQFQRKSFQVCDKDGDGALDWQEVESCEKEYGDYVGLKELPGIDEFEHCDINKDGKLLFDEWLHLINKAMEMII